MEGKNLSLYAKLKMNIGKEIIVSYYSNLKTLKTEQFKLIDIYGFSYIIVGNKKTFTDLYFFSRFTLIESITLVGQDKPIYFNPYAKQCIDPNFNTESEINKKIETAFLSDIDMNQLISERERFIINYYKRGKFNFNELFFSEKQKTEFDILYTQLLKELIEYAKSKGLDSNVKLIDRGTTSLVYSIGDKIIKIGKPRRNYAIPYCEYLLQPIINRNFVFDGIPMRIEVTERVITYKELNEEEKRKFKSKINKLHIKLRSIGLMCTDLYIGNVGILIHDNIIHFDPIDFETGNDIATSIQNNNCLRIRKKGELIILDLDALEIVNVNKYCKYLKKIGYDLDKIDEIKNNYGGKVKIR